jgi:ribosomal protein S18 acetylase RimI-like enzyme
MPHEFQIVRADLADAKEILALQRLAYQTEADIYGPEIQPLRQTLEATIVEMRALLTLKALARDSSIAGSVRAGMRDGVCHIGKLMVRPDMRRRGLATALMKAIEAEFPEASSYELFTGVRSEGNIRLYKRLGYDERNISGDFIFLGKQGGKFTPLTIQPGNAAKQR